MWPLLRCTHLEPSLAVTAFASGLALAVGRGAGTVWVIAAVLAGQFSVGWANDWTDRERDRAAGREDKPVATGEVRVAAVRRGAFTALGLCALLSLASGLPAALVHLGAVGLAWAYNLKLKFTAASVLPYAAAFALLPVFVTLGPPLQRPPAAWAAAAAGLLGAGAHFANALPDLDADRRSGVRGLPQRLGGPRTALTATVLLAAGATTVAVGAGTARAAAGIVWLLLTCALAALIPLTWAAGRERLAFRLAMGAAAATVAGLLAAGSRIA